MARKLADQIAELRGRVDLLEFAVRELKQRLDEAFGPKKPWWEEVARSMPNDEVYQEYLEILRKSREADYAAAAAEADRLEAEERRRQKAKKKAKRAG
jgi:hypothetical protein